MRVLFTIGLALCCSIATAQIFPDAFRKISAVEGGMTIRPNAGARFGIEAVAIGDLDDDGVIDLGVGATNNGGFAIGAVYILFMKPDGTVKSNTVFYSSEPAGESDSFGSSVSALGDLDDDGVEDIGVGTQYDDDGGPDNGAFWVIFMKKDGTVKSRQKISAVSGNLGVSIGSGAGFGSGSVAIGDLDNDGNTDVAVGARFTSTTYILFLNDNGTVKTAKTIPSTQFSPIDTNGLVSYGLAGLGDVDKDGVPDIAIGGHRSDIGFTDSGVVYVVMLTSTGSVKSFKTISTGRSNFTDNASLLGISIAGIGDWDGDGIRDMVVGGDDSGQSTGAIWFMMLNSDGTVKSSKKISSKTAAIDLKIKTGDFFGSSVCFLGDIDNNGTPDLAIGAFQDDDGGAETGAMWITIPDCGTNAGPDVNVCTLQTVTMNASAPSAGETGTWTRISGTAKLTDIHNPKATVTELGVGDNEFKWTVVGAICGTLSDNVKIVAAAPVKPNAGPDVSRCDNPASLNLAGNNPFNTQALWTRIVGTATIANTSNPLSSVSNLTLGDNTFVLSFLGNAYCPLMRDTVTYNISNNFSAYAGPDVNVCSIQTVKMNATPVSQGQTGTWTNVSGSGTLSDIHDPNAMVTQLGIGDNEFKWTVTGGSTCGNTTDNVKIVTTLVVKPNAGADIARCDNPGSMNLSGNNPFNTQASWTKLSGSATFANSNNPQTSVSNLSTGENKFVLSFLGNSYCPLMRDTVTINITTTLNANAGEDQRICDKSPGVTLFGEAVPGVTAEWSLYSGTGKISNKQSARTVVTDLSLGKNVFVWSMTGFPGCPIAADTVNVFVDETVEPNAGVDQYLCEGTLAVALEGNETENRIGQWSVVAGGSTLLDRNSANTIMKNPTKGLNRFVWSYLESNYCPLMSDTVEIIVFTPPIAKLAMKDTTYTCEKQFALKANQSSGFGTWTITHGTGDIGDVNQNEATINFAERNKPVEVTWTLTTQGCPSTSASAVIVPLTFSADKIPNVITPNTDGKNDKWKILNIEHMPNNIRLYNRWGEQVLSTSDYKNNWSGHNLSPGTYYFFINIAGCTGEMKGWLSVVN